MVFLCKDDIVVASLSLLYRILVDLLLKTSEFIDHHTEIEELDLNPVFATEKGVSVVDARIILKANE